MFSKNPYITGNPVGDSPAFVGRDDIFREVIRILQRPKDNVIVLYGQRRIGKTSLLQELEARLLKENNHHPIFFDLIDKAQQPLKEVLQELASKISEVVPETKADLGKNPETTFRDSWLPELLKQLPSEKSLVLLFDEFDVLADPNDEKASKDFFPYLRNLFTINPQRLSFVFAIGRKVDDLNKIALSLFKATVNKRVSLLNYDETVKLIRLSETDQTTLYWENGAVEKIWQLTNGHPYLTQVFCSRVWEEMTETESDKLATATQQDVEKAIVDTLDASCNALEWLWDGLPHAERLVASALATAGAKAMTETELERLLKEYGAHIMVQELQKALPRLLQNWDLIEPVKAEPIEEQDRYRFRVELLRHWIEKYKPLSLVQEDLDRVEPVADDFYNAGDKFYKSGKLKEALEPLRKAISLNPYHVGANLLLANILLALKRANDSVEILEKLYTYNRKAARTWLIKALLNVAQSSKKDDDQLKYYRRILELDADHPEAKTQVQKIWEWRGDKAYKKGQLKEALKIYKMAHLNQKAAKVEQELNHSSKEVKQIKHFERQQQITSSKKMIKTYWKTTLEVVGVIGAFVGGYFWFESLTPTGILFEMAPAPATMNTPAYVITYVASDKPYLPTIVEISPGAEWQVKQARFQYRTYPPIDLIKTPNATAYRISKEVLQTTEWGKDKNGVFEFLDQDRFTFYFQFVGSVPKKMVKFHCQVTATNHLKVPCEIKEKGYLSLFRGIPWFWVAPGLAFVWVLLIEMIAALGKKEPEDDVY